MKKRNVLSVILAIILAVLMCATFAACDKTPAAPDTYTVSFTGENVSIESVTVTSGETVQKPETPTRENYTFGGWLLNGEEFSFETPITSNITLVAKWIENNEDEETFSVAFSGEGVTAPTQTVVKGDTAQTPPDPVREGFIFEGWFLGENKFNFETPITSDITLVAKWIEDKEDEETFSVIFSGEGVTTPTQKVVKGEKATRPSDPVREKFEFLGWYLGDNEFDFNTPITSNITLVAKWTDNEEDDNIVTVKFAGEGVTTPEQSVFKGDTALEPVEPSRLGFEFVGWYLGDEKFDFDTPITENITLIAKWIEKEPTSMTGTGTKQDPYVLWTANDIINFASRVNSPSTKGNEGYYKAWYRLGKDIDMSGVTNYTPAGRVTTYTDADNGEVEVRGFEGVFDGNGHKISNLSMTRLLRSGMSNVGFFGTTYKAVIKDVTFENIHYIVESGADVSSIGAYFGGVAGFASLTNISGVTVSGILEARLFSSNAAAIGGIAGEWEVYMPGKNYIAFTENCFADVEIIPGQFDDSDIAPSLVSVMAGGLYGYVYNSGSAAAIINCSTTGKIDGGQYVGGIAAYLGSSSVSVINCASNMSVRATAKDTSSYVGGIIGASGVDALIMDCVFYGSVRGSRPTSTNNSGYAGEIIGFAASDDYEMYFTAGVAVVNCFHKATIRDAQIRNKLGTAMDIAPTLDWAVDALGWNGDVWTEKDGVLLPTDVLISDVKSSFTVTFANGNEITTDVREYEEGFTVLGAVASLNNKDGVVFYGWELATGIGYRYYMPIVKDVTLTARWQSVEEIVGIYLGTYEYHGQGNAGILQLKSDGTCQWIQTSAVNGTYTFDGEHILFEFFNMIGDVSGTLVDGEINFIISQGASGEVEYTFTKSDLQFFGEYWSDEGDNITFGGENRISLNSAMISTDTISGTFTLNGNTITVTGGNLTKRFTSMTITANEDMSISVNFVGIVPSDSINKVFRKLPAPDYTGEAFVGKYAISYLSTGDSPYQNVYHIQLKADGTAEYTTPYSTLSGSYYVFGETVRLSFEGNTSTFTFNAENGILHGIYNRGAIRRMIAIRVADDISLSDTDIRGYAIDGSILNVVFTLGDKKFLMKDGVWQSGAVISGEFGQNTRVMIDGTAYLANTSLYNNNKDLIIYSLNKIGAEEGSYTRDGKTFVLNGIGSISGDLSGSYKAYGNTISVFLDDDSVFGFDYTAAKAAGGKVTDLKHDGYQGVWYMDRTVSVNLWLENGEQDTNRTDLFIEKYYKFVVDGFGHATLIYFSYDYQEYRYNWGTENGGWGTYELTATGIRVQFNSVQGADVVFYFDNQLAYSRNFGHMGETSLYKEGYTGSMTPPSLPSGVAGSYTGAESDGTAVVLNLRADLTGSYKGVPFIAIYDGNGKVNFVIDGLNYRFDINTKILTYADESVALTLGGEITEVIPGMLCGNWSGVLTGYGMAGETKTISLSSDGTLVYDSVNFNASYDAFEQIITASGANYAFELKYDSENEVLKVEIRVGTEEVRLYEGSFTKA